MAIKLPSHLHRSRSGTLHFRITIPPDVRHHFATGEIYRSLRTASVRDAAMHAQTLSTAFKRLFDCIRQERISDDEKAHKGALIDQAKLAALLESTKQKMKLRDRIEELENEVIEAHRRRLQDKAQHARELDLVMTARSVTPAEAVPSTPVAVASKKKAILLSDAVEEFKRAKLASRK